QVLDIDAASRDRATADGRCVNAVLREMIQHEEDYQNHLAELLGTAPPEVDKEDDEIPIPISNAEEPGGAEADFEHRRAHTINMLESQGENWPSGVLELVKDIVREDRNHTTELAEVRKLLYEEE